ncbi:MAG: MCE family protein, partial [Muribaculaceae bacterium]|nr:MCE family protein [Muribaculaceae bacterium]
QLSYQLKALPLESTVENVNQLTENLSRFSNQLNDKNSTLGLLTSDPELYNRLNQVSADIDSLLVDIKKNPKRYISIKLL